MGLPVALKDQTELYATSKTACHTNLTFSRRSKGQNKFGTESATATYVFGLAYLTVYG